jgi:hypothetical protein
VTNPNPKAAYNPVNGDKPAIMAKANALGTKASATVKYHIYRKEGRTRDVEYFFGVMINKIYLRQKGDDVYQIVYTAGQYSYNDHKEDAGLIFRSFKFLADRSS